MSIFSRIVDAVKNELTGAKPQPIIDSPKTPIESLVNASASGIQSQTNDAAQNIVAVAKATAQQFMTSTVGAVPTAIADASAAALASAAISQMSTSSNKTEEQIGEWLHTALAEFEAA